MVRVLSGFAHLARSILIFFLCLTVVAVVMKILGDLGWTTLGIWVLLDAGAFVAMTGLNWVARRLEESTLPRVS